MKARLLLTILVLGLVTLSLLNASWIAPKPVGQVQLIALRAMPQVMRGPCIAEGNAGYGAVPVKAEWRGWQTAVGLGAQGMLIRPRPSPAGPVMPRDFGRACPVDAARPVAMLGEARAALPNAALFVDLTGLPDPVAAARAVGTANARFIVADAMLPALSRAVPGARAISWDAARACTSAYRTAGWIGIVPESCRHGAALLTLGDFWSLPGWPNRMMARMKASDTDLIIAGSWTGGAPAGLTRVEQYGEVADSFTGFLLVDDIAALGPALKR